MCTICEFLLSIIYLSPSLLLPLCLSISILLSLSLSTFLSLSLSLSIYLYLSLYLFAPSILRPAQDPSKEAGMERVLARTPFAELQAARQAEIDAARAAASSSGGGSGKKKREEFDAE
jgi:hypothetical protein